MNIEQKVSAFLEGRRLVSGVGTAEAACSIASINLALTGRLTDKIPDCMSAAIGRWIIAVQDAAPDDMRNSPEWRALLPLAAGTGRDHEKQVADVALDWMWDTLALIQPIADKGGYGAEWRRMCEERTEKAARAAARAAQAAAGSADAAARAALAAARAASWSAGAAAGAAARAAGDAGAAIPDFWAKADPVGCLRKMIEACE